jgi:spermidine synthase
MLAHVSLCSHPQAKNVLIISDEADSIESEVNRHKNLTITKSTTLDSIRDAQDAIFDVVIIDNDTLNSADKVTFAHLKRATSKLAVVVCTATNYYSDNATHKTLLSAIGNEFRFSMPFNAESQTFIFGSKKFHPTADLLVQKADMIDDLNYYNADIHRASFILPTGVFKNLASDMSL